MHPNGSRKRNRSTRKSRGNFNKLYDAVIAPSQESKKPIETLFILLKHRNKHFQQFNTNSNVQYQLLKWLSELNPSDMSLNSSNEAYLAYIYDVCRRDLNQIRVLLPTHQNSFALSNMFTFKYIPIRIGWNDQTVSVMVLVSCCLLLFMIIMYWKRKWRRQTQRFLWRNDIVTENVLNNMYNYYPASRTSIAVNKHPLLYLWPIVSITRTHTHTHTQKHWLEKSLENLVNL